MLTTLRKFFSLIGQPAKLEFKTVKDVNAQAELTGDYIKSVEASYQDGDYGVSIEFDNEGAQIFFNLTTQLSENKDKLYLYIGGVLFSEPAVQSVISDGKTFISGSMNSYSEAEAYATKILSGTFSVQLELFENSVVSATLGKDALSRAYLLV